MLIWDMNIYTHRSTLYYLRPWCYTVVASFIIQLTNKQAGNADCPSLSKPGYSFRATRTEIKNTRWKDFIYKITEPCCMFLWLLYHLFITYYWRTTNTFTFVGEGSPSLECSCWYTHRCVGTGIGSEIGRKLGLGGLATAKQGLCAMTLK